MGSWSAPVVVAHGFADTQPLPVSVPLLLLGSAAVVLAATRVSSQYTSPSPALVRTVGPTVTLILRVVAVLVIAAIALPATFGRSDTAANPAPLLMFTVGWAGLLVVSAVVGPVWARANPLHWAAPPADGDPHLRNSVGVWPAVGALVVFTAAEQVLEPSTLLVLVLLTLYVFAGAGGALVYGRTWFRVADPIETASRLMGRLAPLGRTGRRVAGRRIRSGVAATATAPGMAAFLGVLVGAGLYDAADPAGGLPARLAIFAAVLFLCAGAATAAARPAFLAPALIPAAAAHVGAHYLAPLLVETQLAAVQASDPFGLGWNLFGLTGSDINGEPIPALVGQIVQLLLLVAGHSLAMVVANDIAARRLRPRAIEAALFPLRAAVLASLVAGVYLWLAV